MRVRILGLADVDATDEKRWRALSDSADVVNGWLDPRFLLPAASWREMADGLRLVVVEGDDDWHGMVPIEVTRPLRRVPLTIASSHGRFMTWHADRRHPVIRAGMVQEVLPLLIDAAAQLSTSRTVRIGEFPREAAWMTADGEPVRGRGHRATRVSSRALVAVSAVARDDDLRRASLTEVVTSAEHLSTRTRRSLLTSIAELEKELGGESLTIVERGDSPGVADEFIAFQSRGWKGNAAIGGAGFALDERYAQWGRDVMARFASDGDLSVQSLVSGDRTLAMNVSLRTAHVWCGFVDAYDEELRRHSPAKVVRLVSTMVLTQDGRHMYDTGMAVDEGDRGGMFNDRIPVWDVEYSRGRRGAAARWLINRGEKWRDRRDAPAPPPQS